jgi:hypothetical protein
MAAVAVWGLVVFVGPDGAEMAAWVMGGPGVPDLEAVEALARWQLWAGRLGGSICLRGVCGELGELLDLAGLRREVSWQAEGGEEEFRVEEEMGPGDPVA